MYALDTNSVVYFFKGMGSVAERLLSTPPREIALPAVVLYELELGLAKSSAPERRRSQVEELVRRVTLLPFGAGEARVTARIRADLERAGETDWTARLPHCRYGAGPWSDLGDPQHERVQPR